MLWTLIKHECRLFATPKQTWIALCGIEALMASLFYALLSQFDEKIQSQLIAKTTHYGLTEDAIHPYLAWCLLLLALCIPICNNYSLSHEKKMRTIQLYRMAGMSSRSIVWAKFLTGWFFWTLILASLLLLPLSLQAFGHLDVGQLLSGALGVWLIAGSVQAITLLFNALCRQPMAAILLTYLCLLMLGFSEWIAPYVTGAENWFLQAGFLYHVKNLLNGLINNHNILYYVGIMGFGLLMAEHAIQPRHCWKTAIQFSLSFLLFSAFIIGGNCFTVEKDVSENKINSLKHDTQQLLQAVKTPMAITLYASKKHPLFEDMVAMLNNAPKINPLITVTANSTSTVEDSHQNQVVLEYQEKTRKIDLTQVRLNEMTFYQALYALLHHKDHWLIFAHGHGERSIYQPGNKSYTQLSLLLQEYGSNITDLSLQETGFVPDNTQIFAITPNTAPFLPAEIDLIQDYVIKGGNMLWLLDANSEKTSLSPLFDQLGIYTSGQVLHPHHAGLEDPSISLVMQYPAHPITESIENLTVFPHAIDIHPATGDLARGWRTNPLLLVKTDKNTMVPIGLSLEREPLMRSPNRKTQRVVVIGCGQFLANETILNYANRELIQRTIDWLAHNDQNRHLIQPPPVDAYFAFPTYSDMLYKIGAPLALGLLPLLIGYCFYRRRLT